MEQAIGYPDCECKTLKCMKCMRPAQFTTQDYTDLQLKNYTLKLEIKQKQRVYTYSNIQQELDL